MTKVLGRGNGLARRLYGGAAEGVCVTLFLRFHENSNCDAWAAFCGARSSTARLIQRTCETRHLQPAGHGHCRQAARTTTSTSGSTFSLRSLKPLSLPQATQLRTSEELYLPISSPSRPRTNKNSVSSITGEDGVALTYNLNLRHNYG